MKRFTRLLAVFLIPTSLPIPPGSSPVVEIARKALPGVVSIQTARKTAPSVGSGVVFRADGTIVTSHHVIEGAEKVTVSFMGDDTPYPARVVAGDPSTDVALIRLEQPGPGKPPLPPLHPLKLGDSDRARTGDAVVAVGNPFGFKHTVTSGIISSRGRNGAAIGAMTGMPGENGPDVPDLIQSDAAINPGNSGGPLLNARGEMIGLNAAIFSQSGGFIGIGFAIPSRVVREITDELLAHGRIIRGWIGVTAQDLDEPLAALLHSGDRKGALVSDVRKGGPAESSGVRVGDLLLDFDGAHIEDALHLRRLVSQAKVGTHVKLALLRQGKRDELKVGVRERAQEPAIEGQGEAGPAADTLAAKTPPARSARDLGLVLQELTPELRKLMEITSGQGVLISQVAPETPAARAGINPGDVILSVGLAVSGSASALEKEIESMLKKSSKQKRTGPLLLWVQRGPGDRIFVALPVS